MPEGGRGPESGASVAAGPVGSAVGPVAFGARAPKARGARHPVSRVPSGSAPRYVPGILLWSGLPPLAPVEPPVLSVPGPYGAPQLTGTPGSVPVVERPRSTTSTGIAPTARRGVAGPSNRATTPTNRLSRPCRGAPPLHDTIPICCRGASPPPRGADRRGARGHHGPTARSPHNVAEHPVAWIGAAGGVRERPLARGRVSASLRAAVPGVTSPGGERPRPESGDAGAARNSRIRENGPIVRNPGRWERLSIPDYGRCRPFPESGTLSAAQRQESRTKPLFSGICDAGADIGAYRSAEAGPPSGAVRHLPPAGGAMREPEPYGAYAPQHEGPLWPQYRTLRDASIRCMRSVITRQNRWKYLRHAAICVCGAMRVY